MKDGKLRLELHSWFLPLQEFNMRASEKPVRLEPRRKGTVLRRNDAFMVENSEWLPRLDSNQ